MARLHSKRSPTKMKLILAFFNVAVLTFFGCTKSEVQKPVKSETPRADFSISIDCTKEGLSDFSAGVLFESINNIVTNSGRGIHLELIGKSKTIVFAIYSYDVLSGTFIGLPPDVEFRPNKIIIDETPKSLTEFEGFLQEYAKANKLLSTRAVLIVKAPEWVSMNECYRYFNAIFDHGIQDLVLIGGEQGSGQQPPASAESKPE